MIRHNKFGIHYLFDDILISLFYPYFIYYTLWAFYLSISCIILDDLGALFFQTWQNIELVPKLTMALTYGEILKWLYIPYGLGHYWWNLVTIGILNRGTMMSHRLWNSVSS